MQHIIVLRIHCCLAAASKLQNCKTAAASQKVKIVTLLGLGTVGSWAVCHLSYLHEWNFDLKCLPVGTYYARWNMLMAQLQTGLKFTQSTFNCTFCPNFTHLFGFPARLEFPTLFLVPENI